MMLFINILQMQFCYLDVEVTHGILKCLLCIRHLRTRWKHYFVIETLYSRSWKSYSKTCAQYKLWIDTPISCDNHSSALEMFTRSVVKDKVAGFKKSKRMKKDWFNHEIQVFLLCWVNYISVIFHLVKIVWLMSNWFINFRSLKYFSLQDLHDW